MALLSDYVAGTVTIAANGTAVTGAGTAWVAAGFREGDVLYAGGFSGIVLTVNSNTSITLAQAWRGGALTAQPYRLRYQGDNSRVTAQARALIDLYGSSGNLAAFAGLASAADRLPYFTGSGTAGLATFTATGRALVAALNAAAAYVVLGEIPNAQLPSRLRTTGGASTDANAITETGTYVVGSGAAGLPEAQAGVIEHFYISSTFAFQRYTRRGTNISYQRFYNNTWSAWQLNSLPILGSVSQAGGVPTGSVIERGSNANGEYVRFVDGTQICTIAAASLAYLNATNLSYTWTMPAVFAATPAIGISLPNAGANFIGVTKTECGAVWQNTTGFSSVACGIQPAASSFTTGDQIDNCRLSAIGRWF